MPSLLMPATAKPFAGRSPPTVVLNTKVDPWLTATLKRINRIKRPLNSAPQHMKCLTETLSSNDAIWTLCSLLVERAPESEIEKNENPIIDALFRYQLLHIQAYVVHIDLVLSNEIAFKLTPETIKDLIDFHKNIYLVDAAAKLWHWPEKDAQVKKLHENFIQTVNKYVYRTDAMALEGMEDDGSGELLCGGSLEVKHAVMGFFVPLLPPPPRAPEVPRPVPLLPSNSQGPNWWSPTPPPNPVSQPPPVESWKVLPSSSPTSEHQPTSSSPQQSAQTAPMWQNGILPELSQAPPQSPQYCQPPVSQPFYTSAPPQLPLPSLVASQCSSGSGTGFGGFGWDRPFHDYATTM